jgi:hypothetical protein
VTSTHITVGPQSLDLCHSLGVFKYQTDGAYNIVGIPLVWLVKYNAE